MEKKLIHVVCSCGKKWDVRDKNIESVFEDKDIIDSIREIIDHLQEGHEVERKENE